MQRVLKKYGIIIIFYLVVIIGAILLNTRLNNLNKKNINIINNFIVLTNN